MAGKLFSFSLCLTSISLIHACYFSEWSFRFGITSSAVRITLSPSWTSLTPSTTILWHSKERKRRRAAALHIKEALSHCAWVEDGMTKSRVNITLERDGSTTLSFFVRIRFVDCVQSVPKTLVKQWLLHWRLPPLESLFRRLRQCGPFRTSGEFLNQIECLVRADPLQYFECAQRLK